MFVAAPIVVRGTPVGERAGGEADHRDPAALLEDMAPFILTVSIVLGVTAALGRGFIGRRIAPPIEALTDFAGRVSEGERRARCRLRRHMVARC